MNEARAKRNVAVLAVCQALFNCTFTIHFALGGLVGYALADDKALATLPVTTVVAGTALCTIPASLLMRRIGRRAGFMVGGAFGLVGSAVACWALWISSFWLYAGGAFLFGAYSAFAQYYRFAAADTASEHFRARAISWVMAGGLVAGFIGPELAKHTKDLIPPILFLGTYVLAGLFCLFAVATQLLLDIGRPTALELREQGRPLAEIVRQPVFIVAAMAGAIGYGTMSLMMTATPLAMLACNHPFDAAATVIQWHVVAMYGPSFFTGALIARFGVLNVILAGAAIMVGCSAVALSGLEVAHFWVAMVLLGIGWNFMFIGGTTLLTESYTQAEKAKTQGLNDFIVFGTTAVSSLSSGTLLHLFGWDSVAWTLLPLVSVAALGTLMLALGRRRVQAA